ncbi:MAG: homoserine dehydrogenase, partial [Selenomonadaceae bacterium]|nr:homoserine dehydrogenase [Selenomonadaceae bacterium]
AVGGAIPIIMPLKRSLTSNKITEVLGIVNGTTNYMLTKMAEDGADYDTVVKEAQAHGYAERNPEADVEGKDAARKIAILASIAFNSRVKFEDVSVEGITKITPEDIQYAASLGYVVKLLAVGRDTDLGVDVRVNPVFLEKNHPLASVSGVLNAIFVRGYPIEEAMFFGPGAGKPTASAVVSDIIEIARGLQRGAAGRFGCTCYHHRQICPVEETVSSYYIRLLVDDKPGVLGKIATTFGNVDVSLKSVVQTTAELENHVEIVVITHAVKHKNILEAEAALKCLSVVDEIFNVIRVE